MPTVLRLAGLRIVIDPDDHHPAHVHVIGPGSEAVYILECPDGPSMLRRSVGFKTIELGRIAVFIGKISRSYASTGNAFMITDEIREAAEERMQEQLRHSPRAVRVRYDRSRSAIVIRLDTGLDVVLPTKLAQGLQNATCEDLRDIEITPTGLGLHWPKLDADLYIPSLLKGRFGSRAWMTKLAANRLPAERNPKRKSA